MIMSSLLWKSDDERSQDFSFLSHSLSLSNRNSNNNHNLLYLSSGSPSHHERLVQELLDDEELHLHWMDVHCFHAALPLPVSLTISPSLSSSISDTSSSVSSSSSSTSGGRTSDITTSTSSGASFLKALRDIAKDRGSASMRRPTRVSKRSSNDEKSSKGAMFGALVGEQFEEDEESVVQRVVSSVKSFVQQLLREPFHESPSLSLVVVQGIHELNESTIRNLDFALRLSDKGVDPDLQGFVVLFTHNDEHESNSDDHSWKTQLGKKLDYPQSFFNGHAFVGRLNRISRQGSDVTYEQAPPDSSLCRHIQKQKDNHFNRTESNNYELEFTTFLALFSIPVILFYIIKWIRRRANAAEETNTVKITYKDSVVKARNEPVVVQSDEDDDDEDLQGVTRNIDAELTHSNSVPSKTNKSSTKKKKRTKTPNKQLVNADDRIIRGLSQEEVDELYFRSDDSVAPQTPSLPQRIQFASMSSNNIRNTNSKTSSNVKSIQRRVSAGVKEKVTLYCPIGLLPSDVPQDVKDSKSRSTPLIDAPVSVAVTSHEEYSNIPASPPIITSASHVEQDVKDSKSRSTLIDAPVSVAVTSHEEDQLVTTNMPASPPIITSASHVEQVPKTKSARKRKKKATDTGGPQQEAEDKGGHPMQTRARVKRTPVAAKSK